MDRKAHIQKCLGILFTLEQAIKELYKSYNEETKVKVEHIPGERKYKLGYSPVNNVFRTKRIMHSITMIGGILGNILKNGLERES